MKTKVESMVTVPIHQASSPVPPLSTPVIDLTPPKPVSPTVQEPAFTATTTTTSTTFPPPPPPQQQSTIDSTLVARVTALEQICENFEKKNKVQDQTAQALSSNENVKEESMERENREEFMDVTTKSRKGRRDDQDPPPPPPKGSDQSKKTRHDSDAFGSKQTPAQTSSSWKSSDTRDTPSSSSKQKPDSQSEQPTNDISIPDDMHLSDTKDIGADHLLKIKTKTDSRTRSDECHLLLTDKIDLTNPEGNRVRPDVSKPLPLGVMSYMKILSAVSLKTYSRYGYTYLKEIILRRADYKEYKILESDFKNLHPNDFEDMYLLHLQGKLNHMSGSDKVNLLNTVNLWIRNIVIRIRVEDLQLGIGSYQTKLNLTEPSWDATDFLFKEDYTIVSKPMAVIYRDRNNQKKMMRETEVHKFSDGMLTRILEKLDHMVKDFRLFKYNPGMENRIWSEDDKRRSKEFMEVIERRLKIRRIFRNLKSFVSGRLRDVDYRLIQRTE
ncbi:hypothetical protein Tco_0574190 [Tanacetum coccineum]